ncbi:VOC family protein [Heyndrickxia sp. NPDC080065]|uniref:VOC family protein n=1 Tax=Heyndrickxia sp. NPDC080065 TaxID=3390568 RepID=UPI003D017F35
MRVTDLEISMSFYSNVLGLKLRDVEQWDHARGANYIISENSPILTLIESKENFQIQQYPTFNLNCRNILELYENLKKRGVKVGELNNWSSNMNIHVDFDIYDSDGNAINLIEWQNLQMEM